MTDSIQTRLASRFDEVAVHRRLHDVPPHEVHEVTVDGQRAVCKVDTGPTGRAGVEGRVMAFVGEQTTVPVPEVLAVDDDWFVAAWHPAAPAPDVEREATVEWARAAGRGLATLHDETAPRLDRYGRITLESSQKSIVVDGDDSWHDAAIAYLDRLESTLTEYGHADIVSRSREQVTAHPSVFDAAGGPVLCHGWWSPEHVAVEAGGVRCAVDFEHAIVAPGEWDYWRTVLPVFDGGESQAAFRDGYESVRALPDGIAERRDTFLLLHSLYFLESLYVQAQHDEAETERRADWTRERIEELLEGL